MSVHESHAEHWTHGIDRPTVERIVAWLRVAAAELAAPSEPVGAGALVDLAQAARAIEGRFLSATDTEGSNDS